MKELISVIKTLPNEFRMFIIGDGILKNEIFDLVKSDARFICKGRLSQKEIDKVLFSSDCLILPSRFDGWGAVVNEALMRGCRVIVSDTCGASDLIRGKLALGRVFNSCDWAALTNAIRMEISKGPVSLEERSSIIAYSECITPDTVARYLFQIVNCYFGDVAHEPQAPWA